MTYKECGVCGEDGNKWDYPLQKYYNKEKNIETYLCQSCEKYADLNGYKIIEVE